MKCFLFCISEHSFDFCHNFQNDQSRRIATKKTEKGAYENNSSFSFQLFKNTKGKVISVKIRGLHPSSMQVLPI